MVDGQYLSPPHTHTHTTGGTATIFLEMLLVLCVRAGKADHLVSREVIPAGDELVPDLLRAVRILQAVLEVSVLSSGVGVQNICARKSKSILSPGVYNVT